MCQCVVGEPGSTAPGGGQAGGGHRLEQLLAGQVAGDAVRRLQGVRDRQGGDSPLARALHRGQDSLHQVPKLTDHNYRSIAMLEIQGII